MPISHVFKIISIYILHVFKIIISSLSHVFNNNNFFSNFMCLFVNAIQRIYNATTRLTKHQI